ncbi:DUF6090 family protein [Cryomorphaceae bacterium 1068]|nr:DUF6090 family protein [Cryomorphaceae bacterium 1068]
MIQIFRKIRQRLLSESRFGKYLLYAFGEIVLVVIGILIAIQLNEWRNDAINSQKRDKVLQALHFEFQSNLAQMDTVQSYQRRITLDYPVVMDLIKTVDDLANDSILLLAHNHMGTTWSFDPINGALRSAISSGEIHLIENDRLLDLLFSWEDVVNDSKEESDRQREFQTKQLDLFKKHVRVGDLWASYYPNSILSHFPSDARGLYKDELFEDYISLSYFMAYEYLLELDLIRANNLEILELIESETVKLQ